MFEISYKFSSSVILIIRSSFVESMDNYKLIFFNFKLEHKMKQNKKMYKKHLY